jgi:hypothetical protein
MPVTQKEILKLKPRRTADKSRTQRYQEHRQAEIKIDGHLHQRWSVGGGEDIPLAAGPDSSFTVGGEGIVKMPRRP